MNVKPQELPPGSYAPLRPAWACAVRLLLSGLAIIGTLCGTGLGLSAGEAATVGLNPNLTLDQYQYREWSMQHGLPSDQVVDILQTRDGYLWLATERGLSRFDGVKFTNFNRSNTPALITNRITTLHEGRDGTLWIGTHRGGLIRCRPGQSPEFQRFAELEGLDIQCLCEDRDGTLWIGSEVATWTVIAGKCAPRRDAPLNVGAICEDGNGTLWFGASIWWLSRPDSVASSDVQPQPGLYRLADDRFYRLTETDGFPQTEAESSVSALCSDLNGGLWIGTTGKALLHYRDGTCEDHAAAVGLQARHSVAIHQDRGGHLWIAARPGGLQRLAGGNVGKLPTNERLALVRCLAEDRDGNIWFGGRQSSLRRISNPDFAMVRLDVQEAPMRCVLEDSGTLADTIWCATDRALSSRITAIPTSCTKYRLGNSI